MAYDIDPELAVVLPHLPSYSFDDVPAAREWLAAIMASLSPLTDSSDIDIDDRVAPGHAGDPDVGVRVFRPSGVAGALPAVLYIHGGGFVIGSVDDDQPRSIEMARELRAVVVSVEYRLSPETPYP